MFASSVTETTSHSSAEPAASHPHIETRPRRIRPLAGAAQIEAPVCDIRPRLRSGVPSATSDMTLSGRLRRGRRGRYGSRAGSGSGPTKHSWIYHAPGMAPLASLELSAERPRWVDERVASRVDPDGTYRELWRTIQR